MAARARHVCPVCARPCGLRPPSGSAAAGEPGGRAVPGFDNPSFPFCSPACKLVDLGRWLDGGYRIAGPPIESTAMMDEDGSRADRRSDEEDE